MLHSTTVPARPHKHTDYTLDDLVDWLLSENYQQLLSEPTSLYEVQRVVVGITADNCGIGVPKILLTDSFTMDLGIS
ncbi:hypothetical protein [Hymenobacter gelipurpurascens]|uniref:hypothetical protein n=1 Tax=Hymenobacter gelipurpurascens TaxID=89968 RepID=UPI000B58A6A4|nr:hypothetical protein [Hymenobacter gelipurpurascens]